VNPRRWRTPVVIVLCVLIAHAAWGQDDAQFAASLEQTVSELSKAWLQAVQAEPFDPDLEGFAATLEAREDIVSAGVQDQIVLATTAEDVLVRFDATPPGVAGAGTSSAPLVLGPALHGAPGQHWGMVPGGKALVIDGHHSGYEDRTEHFRQLLETAGYSVSTGTGFPQEFEQMADAAITVINAHGGTVKLADGAHFYIAAYSMDLPTQLRFADRRRWLTEHEAAVYVKTEWNRTPQPPVPVRTYYGYDLYDTWFERHIPRMKTDAFVLLLTCHGADLDSPWSVFSGKGAGAMLCFTNTADTDFIARWATKMLERTLAIGDRRPSPTAPLHRAQPLHDAFDAIHAEPENRIGQDWTQMPEYANKGWSRSAPVLKKRFAGPDGFSAHPHIDQGWIFRMPGAADYTLSLWGGFGSPEGCSLTIGGQPLQLQWTSAGIGSPWNAILPAGASGDVIFEDRWGRESNPVTVSLLRAQVSIDYEDRYCAGTVEVDYTEPVVGARLYQEIGDEFVFGGYPAWNIDRARVWFAEQEESPLQDWSEYEQMPPGWPLAWGIGNVSLRWDFESEKVVNDSRYVTHDHGQRSFRASDPMAYFGPFARVTVRLPVKGSPQEPECEALVRLEMDIDLKRVTLDGEPAHLRIRPDVDEAQTTFDWETGVLHGVEVECDNCTWRLDDVELAPTPYDPDARAALPVMR